MVFNENLEMIHCNIDKHKLLEKYFKIPEKIASIADLHLYSICIDDETKE